jgi:hypothetical protein
MASEVTISASLTASKGGASIASGTVSKTLDMTGVDMEAITHSCDTVFGAMGIISEIGTNGYLMIKNLDATNAVEVSFDAGSTSHITIPAGAPALFKPKVDPQLKAITALSVVQYWIHEE